MQIGEVIVNGYADAELILALAISCSSLNQLPEAYAWMEKVIHLNQAPEFKLRALEDARLREVRKA